MEQLNKPGFFYRLRTHGPQNRVFKSAIMRLIIGKVRSGKTALIFEEIRKRVDRKEGKTLLLVPEQYSHEAERELCAACGDSMSLYAEVMSFTGLARWGRGRFGGNACTRMDEGGKLLCMSLALKELRPLLKHYGQAAGNPDLQMMILHELITLDTAAVDETVLQKLSDELGGSLGEKLGDLALIREAFHAQLEKAGCSAEDPISVLARQVERYGLGDFDRIYVDGFIDFTGQELAVLRSLLKRKIDLTVCFTGEGRESREEYYLPSMIAMGKLKDIADEYGRITEFVPVTGQKQENPQQKQPDGTGVESRQTNQAGPLSNPERCRAESRALRYFSDHMFDYLAEPYPEETGAIRLITAKNPREECEAVAATILEAVRQEGCRWKDIAVAVRGFEDYRITMESTFRRYGIPLYLTERTFLSEKPLPLWIDTAYEIVLGNWNPEDVNAWLRCGLSGLNTETCDLLCSYLNRWQIRRSGWLRKDRWNQHPHGYGQIYTDETEKTLDRIDRARRSVGDALLVFAKELEAAQSAEQQADALMNLLERSRMPQRLRNRAEHLEKSGNNQLSAEYSQIWELCVNAVLQMKTILQDTPMKPEEFRIVLRNVLSTYDIGTIPVALDRVSAGDFDRMRRRNIKRLFVMGCTDERLPASRQRAGIFTQEERDLLASYDLAVGGGETELWREYCTILQTLSLPHEKLVLSCPDTGFRGEVCIPADVYTRARTVFSLKAESLPVAQYRLSAEAPALLLAASASQPLATEEAFAAERVFRERDAERLETIWNAANRKPDRLSEKAVKALYGNKLRISPSKLENFAGCRFRYYCSYGLRAETEEPAGFHAPEIGSFVHWVLEKTANRVSELGGFQVVSGEELRSIVTDFISEYVHTELNDFEEKSPRFQHLFQRLAQDLYHIVEDTGEELRKSKFQPLSFEMDISEIPGNGELRDEVQMTGIADRVDGWIQDGTAYLRIVDYKTGKKKFSLSDVWYCRNLQMLLYLFSICNHAVELYGLPGIPAGIIYLPAREEILHFDGKPDDTEKEKKRLRGKRRSGLVLADPKVIEAWEPGNNPVYMPAKTRLSDPMITEGQMQLLKEYVRTSISDMVDELQSGEIEPNPDFTSESSNSCVYCPYQKICRFEEGEYGERRLTPSLSDEDAWKKIQERIDAEKLKKETEKQYSRIQENIREQEKRP